MPTQDIGRRKVRRQIALLWVSQEGCTHQRPTLILGPGPLPQYAAPFSAPGRSLGRPQLPKRRRLLQLNHEIKSKREGERKSGRKKQKKGGPNLLWELHCLWIISRMCLFWLELQNTEGFRINIQQIDCKNTGNTCAVL